MPGGIGARRDQRAAERPLRVGWRLFAGTFAALAVVTVLRVAIDRAPLDLFLVALVLVTGLLAVRHQGLVRELEAGRRTEAEAFARILRGLSRSVSPDAIVGAIVDELAGVTGADHVVVVRRHAHPSVLEATLVSSRPGVPSSTTLLPATALEDAAGGRRVAAAVRVSEPVAVAAGGMPSHPPEHVPSARVATPSSLHAAPIGGGTDGAVLAIAASAARAYGLANTIAEPLLVEGRVAGAIVLSRRTRGGWAEPALRMLAAAATEASAALERADSYREAAAAASTDGLTGLPNRRY
ncbi:MAG TPA: GAF domain-containing protein, partial [Candidatus Limnocylindrales bacterium]